MPIDDADDLADVDADIQRDALYERARAWLVEQYDDEPSEEAVAGIAHMMAFDDGPWTSNYRQLLRAGVELPPPEFLSDDEVTAKLWEVIHALAAMRVFLSTTDHLSDAELYEYLWTEVLHEAVPDLLPDQDSACHIDLLSNGSEPDTYLWFRFFADDEDRRHWLASFPDYLMPERETPPYDRDRLLPKARYG